VLLSVASRTQGFYFRVNVISFTTAHAAAVYVIHVHVRVVAPHGQAHMAAAYHTAALIPQPHPLPQLLIVPAG
jgi:hypothetical protein